MRPGAVLGLLLLAGFPAVRTRAGEGSPPTPGDARREVAAACWFEGPEGARETLTAVYRRPGPGEPLTVWIGIGGETGEAPGHGVIRPDTFRKLTLNTGRLLLVRRRHVPLEDGSGPPRPASAVLLSLGRPDRALLTHDLDHGELPALGFFFGRPLSRPAITVDRHVVEIGATLRATLSAPGAGFFREETLEIARVARRLPVGSGDPDGVAGHVRVLWDRAPEKHRLAAELTGKAGEERIRSHFTQPRCAWANRHVGWMKDLWLIEYRRPAVLTFTLDTTPVKRPGLVSNLWRGNGAWCIESIYPNGFGRSSSNLDLPPVLIVPRSTPVREISFP